MPEAYAPDIRAEALELRRQGWSLLDISLALEVSPQIVGRWAKLAGLSQVVAERPSSANINPSRKSEKHYSSVALEQCWPAPVSIFAFTNEIGKMDMVVHRYEREEP